MGKNRRPKDKPPAQGAKAAAAAARPKTARGLRKKKDPKLFIKKLNIEKLHDVDINNLMIHCASVLATRNIINDPQLNANVTLTDGCYIRAANSQLVTIFDRNSIILQENVPEQQAIDSGYRPC